MTLSVGTNSSLIDLPLTNLVNSPMLPALSLVPLALAPPNGCCPTTAPVDLQSVNSALVSYVHISNQLPYYYAGDMRDVLR